MSNYRFGCDDYGLSYYPSDASDGIGGTDWEKVERVEIEGVDFVRERTCEVMGVRYDDMWGEYCIDLSCGCQLWQDSPEPPNYCEECGVRVVKR